MKQIVRMPLVAAALTVIPWAACAQGQQQSHQPSQKITQESTSGQGTGLTLSPAVVRQVQQKLNARGYDTGGVQGQWNQSSQRALKNFQQAQGLEPTGQLNLSTLSALGVNEWGGSQGTAGRGGQGVARGGSQGAMGAGGQGVMGGARGGAAPGTAAGGQAGGQALTQETSGGSGARLTLSPAEVRQIQQKLNQRGYDVGSVNGTWNQQTSRALRNFQQAQGFEPTGSPNPRTIQSLGLQQMLGGGAGAGASTGGPQSQGGQAQGSRSQGAQGMSSQRITQEQAR